MATGMSTMPALSVPGIPNAAARPASPHVIATVRFATSDQRPSAPVPPGSPRLALPELVAIPSRLLEDCHWRHAIVMPPRTLIRHRRRDAPSLVRHW